MVGRLLVFPSLLACGLLADGALGALQPGRGHPPLLTLAVVAAIALAGGVRVGLVTGFVAGVALDLLAGPAALAGTLTLVDLAVGALVGSLSQSRERHRTGWVALIGALAVTSGGLLLIVLRRLGGVPAGAVVVDVMGVGALAGALVAPLAFRLALWPLLQRPAAS